MNKIKFFVIFVSAILSSSQKGFALFDRFFEKLSPCFVYSTSEQKSFYGDGQQPRFDEEIDARDKEDGSRTAGTVSFAYDADASNCCLTFLLVSDDYRGKGLGTELLKRALFRMIDVGCREVEGHAYPFRRNLTQGQLNAFYAKRGGKGQDDSDNFVYKIGPFAKTRALVRIQALACQKKLTTLFLPIQKLGAVNKEAVEEFIYTIPNN